MCAVELSQKAQKFLEKLCDHPFKLTSFVKYFLKFFEISFENPKD